MQSGWVYNQILIWSLLVWSSLAIFIKNLSCYQSVSAVCFQILSNANSVTCGNVCVLCKYCSFGSKVHFRKWSTHLITKSKTDTSLSFVTFPIAPVFFEKYGISQSRRSIVSFLHSCHLSQTFEGRLFPVGLPLFWNLRSITCIRKNTATYSLRAQPLCSKTITVSNSTWSGYTQKRSSSIRFSNGHWPQGLRPNKLLYLVIRSFINTFTKFQYGAGERCA